MREELSSPSCRNCCLKREEYRGRLGGSKRAEIGWRASDRRCVEVGEDVREKSRPRELEERTCVMEERRSVLGAAHLTPLSQKALQNGSLHYVKKGEQVI